MRAHEAATAAISDRSLHVKVTIDAIDITALWGKDWLLSASWEVNIDAAVTDLTLALHRDEYLFSAAPLVESSPVNISGIGTPRPVYSPLLKLGALVVLSVSEAPTRAAAGSLQHPWHEVFRGRIDLIDWNSSPITIRARDLAADVLDKFSEVERAYGLTHAARGVRRWAPGVYLYAGDYVVPASLNNHTYRCTVAGIVGNVAPEWPTTGTTPFTSGDATLVLADIAPVGWFPATAYAFSDILLRTVGEEFRYFVCVVAGTSGGTEPTWPTTAGATVNDGTARWQAMPDIQQTITSASPLALEAAMQAILNENLGDSIPPLWTPTSPGYWCNAFAVDRVSILGQLRALAGQIGWTVRLAYNPSASDHATWGKWRLCFYAPDRAKTVADVTLTADEYSEATACEVDINSIRNVIEVTWSDAADPWPNGDPKRKTLRVEELESIATYGRRFMAILKGSSSLVNSAAEADALAVAVLSDLAQPNFAFTVEMPFRWWFDLGDLVTFAPNGQHFDTEKSLAVSGYAHTTTRDAARTSLRLRGKPSAGVDQWIAHGTGPGVVEPDGSSLMPAPSNVQAAPIIAGGVISFDAGQYGEGIPILAYSELHLSVSSGFTPSPTTRHSRQYDNPFTVSNLAQGVTYYGRLYNIGTRGERSAPSEEFSWVTGAVATCSVNLDADSLQGRSSKIAHDRERLDHGGLYDLGDERIEAPTDGIYRVFADAHISGLAVGETARLLLVGNKGSWELPGGTIYAETGDAPVYVFVQGLVELQATEDLEVWIDCSGSGDVTVLAGAKLEAERLSL